MEPIREYITKRNEDSCGIYWLNIEARCLGLYCALSNTYYKQEIAQRVLNSNNPDMNKNENFLNDVNTLCDKIDFDDYGSNHTYLFLRSFVVWALFDIDKRFKASLEAKKLDRLKELESEKIKIEAELNEIRQIPISDKESKWEEKNMIL